MFGDVKGWLWNGRFRSLGFARDDTGVGDKVGPGKDGSVIAAPVPWIPAYAGKTRRGA